MKPNNKPHRIGIRTRLLAVFLVATVIPLLLFGVLLFYSSNRELEQEVSRTYTQTIQQIGVTFTEYVSRVDQTNRTADNTSAVPLWLRNDYTADYATRAEVRALEKSALLALEQFSDTNGDIFALSAVSIDGDSLSYTDGKFDRSQADLFSDYYKPLRESTGNTVLLPATESSYAFAPDTPVFTVAYKHLDVLHSTANSHPLYSYSGYIIAECPISQLEEFCRSVDLGTGSTIYILDGNNGIVYSTEENADNRADVTALAQASASAVGRATVGGQDCYLVETVIPDTDWSILASIPYELLTARSDDLQSTFIMLCIVSVIIVSIVTFLVSGTFTRPILRLRNAMKKVGSGDLSVRVPVSRSDEIGELTEGFNSLTERVSTLIENVSEAQEREATAKYQMLQSQINPHFLYNTLDTIRMMAILEDKTDIAAALLNLSDLFRYHVRESSKIVTVEEELSQVKNYLALQQLRLQDKLSIRYEIDRDVLGCRMPKILLQPLLENAFAHGFANLEQGGELTIRIIRENGLVQFAVHDNGQGMDETKLQELRQRLSEHGASGEHGIGLPNVNERLRLYFSEEHTLRIESTEGVGTTVSFSIPLLEGETALYRYEKIHTDKEANTHE